MQDYQFTPGAAVYDAAGVKVGTLHAYDKPGAYLAVRTGGLFRKKDLYIPLQAVSRSDAGGIALQLSRADLKAAHYDFPWPQNEHRLEHVVTPPTGGGAAGAARADQSATPPETMTTGVPAMSSAVPPSRFSSLDG